MDGAADLIRALNEIGLSKALFFVLWALTFILLILITRYFLKREAARHEVDIKVLKDEIHETKNLHEDCLRNQARMERQHMLNEQILDATLSGFELLRGYMIARVGMEPSTDRLTLDKIQGLRSAKERDKTAAD